jgi:di/tripeptidase
MNPHTTSEKVEVKSIENFVGFLETVINRFDEIERH